MWQSLKHGDHAEFEVVYRSHVRQVHAFALRRCSTLADAEDVVAHCFTELWHQRALVEPDAERGFLPWLFTVAARHINAVRARDLRRTELATTAAQNAEIAHAADNVDSSLVELIDHVIASSSPADEAIARLAWEQGLTSKEIEERTGIRASTVRTRLQGIRRRVDAARRQVGRDG